MSSSINCSNDRHIARIVVLRYNEYKRKEVKWLHNSSSDGISSTTVGVAARVTVFSGACQTFASKTAPATFKMHQQNFRRTSKIIIPIDVDHAKLKQMC
jgi:hypothetical protein